MFGQSSRLFQPIQSTTMYCTMSVVCANHPIHFFVKESYIEMQLMIGDAFGKLVDGAGIFVGEF